MRTAPFVVAIMVSLAACSPKAPDHGEAWAPARTDTPETETAQDPEGSAASKNPFGVPDIREEYFGDDVADWYATVSMPGADDDPNAESWAVLVDPDAEAGIEGQWAGRWRLEEDAWREGTAEIRTAEGRAYILFTDHSDEFRYLIEARIEGDNLVGVYQNLENDYDSAPWAGLVVGSERIDGYWPNGRWDFRRRIRRTG